MSILTHVLNYSAFRVDFVFINIQVRSATIIVLRSERVDTEYLMKSIYNLKLLETVKPSVAKVLSSVLVTNLSLQPHL